MIPDECVPAWFKANLTCPYGYAIPGSVTVPNQLSPAKLIAVVYSLLPFAIVLLNAIELILRRGTRQISFLIFSGLITLSNEVILKGVIAQPRPGASGLLHNEKGSLVGSCLISCGMPSSHAALSIGFLVLMICDGIYRVVPSKDELEMGADRSLRLQCQTECLCTWFSTTPLSPSSLMSHKEFVVFFSVWFFMLVPVPIMRMRVFDHSSDQAALGSLIGFVWGILWFLLMQVLTRRWSKNIGQHFCHGLITHDYKPAEFRVKLNSLRDVVGSVVSRGAEIIMPSDHDLRGSLQLHEFEPGWCPPLDRMPSRNDGGRSVTVDGLGCDDRQDH